MRFGRAMAALVLAIGSGCSSGGSTGSGAGAPRAPSHQSDVITDAEIASRAGEASNALQVVQKLRPQMLRGRGRLSVADSLGTGTLPRVIVDDVAFGAIENLANVNAMAVKEIRFVNAADATTRWGTGYPGGVIFVAMKR